MPEFEKKNYFRTPKSDMAKLTVITRQYAKVLQCAVEADPSAFYVGEDRHAVTGGRLTAYIGDGEVVVSSNRFSEEELRRIFAAFLPTS